MPAATQSELTADQRLIFVERVLSNSIRDQLAILTTEGGVYELEPHEVARKLERVDELVEDMAGIVRGLLAERGRL